MEVQELLSYIIPFLIMYNAWLHNQIISAQKEIAVNSAKDEETSRQFMEIKSDIKEMKKELHNYILKQA